MVKDHVMVKYVMNTSRLWCLYLFLSILHCYERRRSWSWMLADEWWRSWNTSSHELFFGFLGNLKETF
jgi:hypothetical protein